jgi:hypothetical protein
MLRVARRFRAADSHSVWINFWGAGQAARKNTVTKFNRKKNTKNKMNNYPGLIKNDSKFVFALAGMLALTIASAKASPPGIYTSGPFTTSTPISFTTTDWSNSLVFPKYTPDGDDVLISIDLFLQATLRTTLTVQNTGDSASSGTARTELYITVQDPMNLLQPVNTFPPPFYVPQIYIISNPYSYSLLPGASTSSGLLTKNGSATETYTLASILSQFTGTGNITLSANTFTETLLANTGGNTRWPAPQKLIQTL